MSCMPTEPCVAGRLSFHEVKLVRSHAVKHTPRGAVSHHGVTQLPEHVQHATAGGRRHASRHGATAWHQVPGGLPRSRPGVDGRAASTTRPATLLAMLLLLLLSLPLLSAASSLGLRLRTLPLLLL